MIFLGELCVSSALLSYVTASRLPITIVFCGSKKSLASGLPMASVLFAGHVGLGVIPVMLFHQIQLMALARRYARAGAKTHSTNHSNSDHASIPLEGIEPPAALALLLRADLGGPAERKGECLMRRPDKTPPAVARKVRADP